MSRKLNDGIGSAKVGLERIDRTKMFRIDCVKRASLFTLVILAVLFPKKGIACGIGWTEPKSHFDGVDYQGNVMLVEHLGEIDAGQGLKLPFYAIFNSNSGNNSPYAGYGWTVPLLEARVTQQDENTFRLDQPDGWFRMFWRSKNNPNVLEGQGGWKAEIRGDVITAWADCGSKLVFSKGRLLSMQLKERKFDFVYVGNHLAEIRDEATSILWVERERITGEVTGFRLSDHRQIGIERGKRPRVQVINNQNMVAGMDQALIKITRADDIVSMIDYAIDGKLNPIMKMCDRLIVWNAASKKIMRDGGWGYEIAPGSGLFDNAAIKRINSTGQKESWFYDSRGNKEISESIDGVETVRSWFGSGLLKDKDRSIVRKKSGQVIQDIMYSYNEDGNLSRVIRLKEDIEVRYKYDGDRVSTEEIHDGRVTVHEEADRAANRSYSWMEPDIEIYSSRPPGGEVAEIRILKAKREISKYTIDLGSKQSEIK